MGGSGWSSSRVSSGHGRGGTIRSKTAFIGNEATPLPKYTTSRPRKAPRPYILISNVRFCRWVQLLCTPSTPGDPPRRLHRPLVDLGRKSQNDPPTPFPPVAPVRHLGRLRGAFAPPCFDKWLPRAQATYIAYIRPRGTRCRHAVRGPEVVRRLAFYRLSQWPVRHGIGTS